jgi:hypothetical protein
MVGAFGLVITAICCFNGVGNTEYAVMVHCFDAGQGGAEHIWCSVFVLYGLSVIAATGFAVAASVFVNQFAPG